MLSDDLGLDTLVNRLPATRPATGPATRLTAIWLLVAWVGCGLTGCNAFDAPPPEGGVRRVVPTDARAAVQALSTPPPIMGGTLAFDAETNVAVVADPDRDRVSFVSLERGVVGEVELGAGEQPQRVTIDAGGRAHVVLRGTGELASFSLDGEALARRNVCRAPRGVAYDANLDALRIACAEGKLVTLSADPTAAGPASPVQVPEDVRDVVVLASGELLVSRFKDAEVLRLGADGTLLGRSRPRTQLRQSVHFDPQFGERVESTLLEPHIAYRLRGAQGIGAPGTRDKVVMIHQGAMVDEVDLSASDPEAAQQASPYGGGSGFGCGGIVSTELSVAGSDGIQDTASIPNAILPVDVAVAPMGGTAAVAVAGSPDLEAPKPFVLREADDHAGHQLPTLGVLVEPGQGQVVIAPLDEVSHQRDSEEAFSNCHFFSSVAVPGQPTAVTFADGQRLLVQSREPALLTIVDVRIHSVMQQFDLGGVSVVDTGHELFHRDTGAGIACASCHAEGGDDGHVWTFSGIGARRTQAVNVGLEGTAPFHWDGDMDDLGTLMSEVFVGRMGGVHQSPERMTRMRDWLFAQEPPRPLVDPDAAAARRGQAIFEAEETGCTGCHGGPKLTDNRSYFVGTTTDQHPLQVPTLRGIGYRAPFMHDGCAKTLRDRFDPTCGGGDLHGQTSQLSADELDELVAYLKTR